MGPQEVDGGIYIDYECNRILKISKGVFIPTEFRTSDTKDAFEADLKAFREKWFKRGTIGGD